MGDLYVGQLKWHASLALYTYPMGVGSESGNVSGRVQGASRFSTAIRHLKRHACAFSSFHHFIRPVPKFSLFTFSLFHLFTKSPLAALALNPVP